jgi:hypothetical protein
VVPTIREELYFGAKKAGREMWRHSSDAASGLSAGKQAVVSEVDINQSYLRQSLERIMKISLPGFHP